MALGVEEHARAHAVLAARAGEHVAVDAAGLLGCAAAFPVLVVLGQFAEGHGHVAERRVDAHDGAGARQSEDLRLRPAHAAEREGQALDARGEMVAAELRDHDEARVGHVVLVFPALDVAEAGELFAVERDDGLALLHLRGHILVGAARDARPAHLGRVGDGLEYGVYVFFVGGIGHKHADAVVVFFHSIGLQVSCCRFYI